MATPRTCAWALIASLSGAASAAPGAESWPQFRGPGGKGTPRQRQGAHAGARPGTCGGRCRCRARLVIAGGGRRADLADDGDVMIRDVSLRLLAFDEASGSEMVNVEVFRVRRPGDINPKNSWASPTPIVDGEPRLRAFRRRGHGRARHAAATACGSGGSPYQSQHGAGGSPVLHGGAADLQRRRQRHRRSWSRSMPPPGACGGSANGARPGIRRTPRRSSSGSANRADRQRRRVPRRGLRAGHRQGDLARQLRRRVLERAPAGVRHTGWCFIATGFQQPSLLAVRPDGTGDVTKTHVAWRLQTRAPLTPSPIVVGAELYLSTTRGILTSCVDARTGRSCGSSGWAARSRRRRWRRRALVTSRRAGSDHRHTAGTDVPAGRAKTSSTVPCLRRSP